MRSAPVRGAEATFSALVRATQEGEPAAVVVSVADAARLFDDAPASLAEHLLAFPGRESFARDPTPIRDIDL